MNILDIVLSKKINGGGGGAEMLAKVIDRTVEDIVIPDGVTNVGEYAFYNCVKAKSITIPDSVKEFADNSFSMLGISNGGVKFPVIANGAETIGGTSNSGNVFGGALNVNKIVLPKAKKIRAAAFSGCTSVAYIYIGADCTSIGGGAFGGVPITCKVECGFAEGAVSGFPANAGFAGSISNLDITYNVSEPTQ